MTFILEGTSGQEDWIGQMKVIALRFGDEQLKEKQAPPHFLIKSAVKGV